MIWGYSTASIMSVPYVVLGEEPPSVLVIPGVEPEHRIPEGLRLQGVRGAFETLAEQQSLAVAWRADRDPAEISMEAIADDYVDLIRELEMADVVSRVACPSLSSRADRSRTVERHRPPQRDTSAHPLPHEC